MHAYIFQFVTLVLDFCIILTPGIFRAFSLSNYPFFMLIIKMYDLYLDYYPRDLMDLIVSLLALRGGKILWDSTP